ncbi:MAG TPA: metallophosphoesterase family protein [Cerasibacillus sp.]|uniref:metallophosphoesterase family protein n=1 Tax=Cerasibacillus sp. TaxID=2498711 RepID=UPI002F3FBD9A
MNTFVCSDIHGEYEAWMQALKKSKLNLEAGDRLILIGDLIDRGKGSLKCLTYVFKLMEKYPSQVTYLMGNHEEIFLDFVNRPKPDNQFDYMEMMRSGERWIRNGGLATVQSMFDESFESYYDLYEMLNKKYVDLIQKMNDLPLYLIDDDNRCVYVHAGFKSGVPLSKQKREDMLWIRHEFYKQFKAISGDVLNDKLIIHGHTPVKYFSDWNGEGYYHGGHHLCIDGGAYDGGAILVLKVEDLSFVEVSCDKLI